MPSSRSKGPKSAVPGRPSPVTSYDVARRAKVAQSTVSRCFTPGASMSAATRKRIMAAAHKLGYRPNAIARSLVTRRSNLVAIIISNLTNLFYPEVLSELSQRFSARGVRVLLFTLPRESDIDPVLEQIWQYRVDGVVAAAQFSSVQVAEFEQHQLPLVFFNRYLPDRTVNAVCCDQLEGARQLVTRLHAAGHRRYGIISGPSDSVVSEERVRGAVMCLKELKAAAPLLVDGDYGYDGGVRALHKLLGRDGKTLDAIICANDVTALGCMDAARYDFGLKVPESLSIVGFDGVDPSRWQSYRLTTLRQPVPQMAEAAVSMLMDRIEDSSLPREKRLFSGEILDRGSARLG